MNDIPNVKIKLSIDGIQAKQTAQEWIALAEVVKENLEKWERHKAAIKLIASVFVGARVDEIRTGSRIENKGIDIRAKVGVRMGVDEIYSEVSRDAGNKKRDKRMEQMSNQGSLFGGVR